MIEPNKPYQFLDGDAWRVVVPVCVFGQPVTQQLLSLRFLFQDRMTNEFYFRRADQVKPYPVTPIEEPTK